jgi:AcrR family transcriptional regulator
LRSCGAQNIILEMQNKVLSSRGPESLASRAVERALAERRDAYADEVRRLLEAGFALIQKQGDLEPRVSEVVREAGLSNQAFYRHFPSKQAFLVAVLDQGVRVLADYLAHRMRAAKSPLGQVRAWLLGILEQALDPKGAAATRPFALARGRLAESFPEEVAESERQLTALLRGAIEAAAQAGEIPAGDSDRDAETLYHLAMGWMQARLAENKPADRRDGERLVDFALAGLARGAGARAGRG